MKHIKKFNEDFKFSDEVLDIMNKKINPKKDKPNIYRHKMETKFPCTFTIMTDKPNNHSVKKDGYHFLVNDKSELDKMRIKYKKGDFYHGEKIISISIHEEDFGEF